MKKLLRSQFDEMSRSVDVAREADVWRDLEARVLDFCLGSSRFEAGSVVTLFGGLRGEVDLVANVMDELKKGGLRPALFGLRPQEVGEPFVGEMDAYLLDGGEQVRRGRFGIWEPDCSRTLMVEPEDLAAILVPGLFFSAETGARLGRGGGFFDRYLGRTPVSVMRVGVALEWQLRGDIPLEAHDQLMDWLVTDERIVRCG